MTSLRPSKKVAFVFIACLLALGAVVFAAQYSSTSSANGTNGSKSAENGQKSGVLDTKDSKNGASSGASALDSEFLKQISDLDDDGDGIKNWEETLVGLEASGETESLSETDKFSREFFAKYIEAKKNGTLDQKSLIQELIDGQTVLVESKKYTAADVIIIPPKNSSNSSSEKTALKDYGNKIGLILENYPTTNENNEYEIINEAMAVNSRGEIEKLDLSITRYENIIRNVKITSVPASVVPIHIAILNNLEAVKSDILGLKKIFSDPVVGLVGLKKYKEDSASLELASENLRNFFDENGVLFTQSEHGFVLTNAI